MLSFFYNNQLRAYIGLLLLFFLIHAASYVHFAMPLSTENGIFAAFFATVASPILSLFLGSSIHLANALLINRIYNRHGFGAREHVMPALFFLLFSSALPQLLYFNPLSTAVFFFLLSFHTLLTLYSEVLNHSEKLFQTGLLLGLAILFFPPFIFFLPWAVISMLILQKMTFRSWLIWVFGLITPAWITFAILFLLDRNEAFLKAFEMLQSVQWSQMEIAGLTEVLLFAFLLILFLLSIGFELKNQSKVIMQRRKFHTTLMLLYPFLLLMISFTTTKDFRDAFYIFFIPFSISVAYLYENQWQRQYLRILFYSFLILVLSHQYLNFDLINYIIP